MKKGKNTLSCLQPFSFPSANLNLDLPKNISSHRGELSICLYGDLFLILIAAVPMEPEWNLIGGPLWLPSHHNGHDWGIKASWKNQF